MTFISNIFYYITYDFRATIISLVFGLIIYYLAKFYTHVFSLPPGPIPLPFVGNVLLFRGTKENPALEIIKLSKKYGPVFTFWLGNIPTVMIFDIDIARETFRKNEFSGRPESYFGKQFSNEKYSDVVMADYGHTWEALRKVSHSAVRKYAKSDNLAYLVSDVIDDMIRVIIEKEGINKPFSPLNYIYLTFFNILASSVFGKRYDLEDKEFKRLKYIHHDSQKEMGNKLLLCETIPLMRLIYRKLLKKQRNTFEEFIDTLMNKYLNHHKDYNESVIRDFCDALISAKNEALAEGKESAPYLTDDNLGMVIFDLFLAGTDTSQHTFKWLLLLLSYYPEIQNKLRQEIDTNIGDRMPLQEDIHNCHYVNAFISETLRFRNVVPTGVFHKAVVQAKIGDLTIPEGTTVFVHQYSILNDDKYWDKPHVFSPERFLENGKYMTSRPSAFIPFSLGRRVCLGEKLALADLFLVLVRFLQSTNDYDIVLDNESQKNGLEPDPNFMNALTPLEYKVLFRKKQNALSS